jgi:CBS domain-containing protein
MAIGEICSRDVVFVQRGENITTTAQLMRQHHVGSVVVVDERNGKRMPAGIVTDRDIVVAVVALGLNPDAIQAGDVMSQELITVGEGAGVAETTELMRMKGVRRLPVTDGSGALVGIVASDDVLSLLAEEMSALASMVSREHRREAEIRKKIV